MPITKQSIGEEFNDNLLKVFYDRPQSGEECKANKDKVLSHIFTNILIPLLEEIKWEINMKSHLSDNAAEFSGLRKALEIVTSKKEELGDKD
jgi:hypothetical protein